jgi:hypothetical protein
VRNSLLSSVSVWTVLWIYICLILFSCLLAFYYHFVMLVTATRKIYWLSLLVIPDFFAYAASLAIWEFLQTFPFQHLPQKSFFCMFGEG